MFRVLTRRLSPAMVVAVLALFLAVAGPARAASGKLLWSNLNNGTVEQADLATGAAGSIRPSLAGSEPGGTAVDLVTGRVYWADHNLNRIFFASLDGSETQALSTGSAPIVNPFGLAIDPITRTIYWANFGASSAATAIGYAKLDGSGGGALTVTGATPLSPSGVAVDLADGRLYWTNQGNPGYISYASLDNSGNGHDITPAAGTIHSPEGIAIDPATGRMYWANFGSASIAVANLDGSSAALLNTTGVALNHPAGVALDAADNKLYWADDVGTDIASANLDGSGAASKLPISAGDLSGPSFPAVVTAPAGTGAPALGGGTTVGSTLSCSTGTWAEDLPPSLTWRAPQSFSYTWTLNGSAIPSETGSTLTRAAAGVYTCAAVATNFGGSATQSSAAHSVLATLTVTKTGPGTVSGAGLNCPGSCTAGVAGTAVTLTAKPAAGASFTGWSGACTGAGSCTVTVDRDTTVSATFKAAPPQTKLRKATISAKHRTAAFVFSATGAATSFACALVKGSAAAKFTTCKSPKTYKHLQHGNYTFEVRAAGPGGTDASPAAKRFNIT